MIRFTLRLAAVLLLWGAVPRIGAAQGGLGQGNPLGQGAVTSGAGATPGKLTSMVTVSVDGAVNESTHGGINPSDVDPAFSDGSLTGTSVATNQQFSGVRMFSSASAQLSLGKGDRNGGWQLGGGSALRFYPGLSQVMRSRDNLNGAVSYQIGARMHVQGVGYFAYSPYYSLAAASSPINPLDDNVFDGKPAPAATAVPASPAAVDYSVTQGSAYSSATRGTVGYDLGQHTSLSFFGGTQRTDFAQVANPSLNSWDARIRFQHQLTERTGVHLGYGRRVGTYSRLINSAPVVVDDIELGVDHMRDWSLTRNTTVSVIPGMTITKDGAGRRYGITLAAALDHLVRRTGHMGIRYDRQVSLVGGLAQPLYSDSISGNYNEWFGRRVAVGATVGYIVGHVGQGAGTANDYGSYNAQLRMSLSAGTHSAIYADYIFYQHNIGSSVLLPGTITPQQRYQAIRTGLALRLPLSNGQRRR